MAKVRPPAAALFFCGCLAADDNARAAAREAVAAAWGAPALESPAYPFADTAYYADETGDAIQRQFWGFAGLFDLDLLAARKREANALENELARRLASRWPRPVNLDPGYVTPAKLVLASAKNYAHRIWIGGGIYAEVTRGWRGGRFVDFPWTFPDYASGRYDDFFLALRRRLMRARRALTGVGDAGIVH